MKYEIISYDVWGNARDGFNVNQAFHTGRYVELPDDASDYLINRRLGIRGVEWDGEPKYLLYATNKRNGRPELELHAVTDDEQAWRASAMKAEQALREIYLDWANNYLSVETFALDHGLTTSDAQVLIDMGRVYQNMHAGNPLHWD